jgi:hypothetical protein
MPVRQADSGAGHALLGLKAAPPCAHAAPGEHSRRTQIPRDLLHGPPEITLELQHFAGFSPPPHREGAEMRF